MDEKTVLHVFPSNKVEALTMLYLDHQDISSLTPTELASKYKEAYEEIHKALKSKLKTNTLY